MERVLIIGSSGAGKSTMSVALGEKTGLPVVHLDKLFWREGWQHISREEFDRLLAAELEKPLWIIDGNYDRTLPVRMAYCDTVIYLDYPRWQCMLGVAKRILTTYGKVRPDMGSGCPERFDREFIKWVWNFNRDKRAGLYQALQQAENIKIIILKNRKAGKAFLQNLPKSGR
ncbi:MAG: topology modulation protein [Oscillospiraceae bacterium]|nr:topology modulation protein [Oscillospiraceae bacterium]